jgi:hypothetical protein
MGGLRSLIVQAKQRDWVMGILELKVWVNYGGENRVIV